MITKKKRGKKRRSESMNIMFAELRGMTKTFAVCNAVFVAVLIIYGFVANHDFRYYTGLAAGNIAAVLNFYALGVKAERVVRMKNAEKAKAYANSNYVLRMLGAFAVFGGLVWFGLISAVPAVLPLFIPRIHYTVKAIFNKEV